MTYMLLTRQIRSNVSPFRTSLSKIIIPAFNQELNCGDYLWWCEIYGQYAYLRAFVVVQSKSYCDGESNKIEVICDPDLSERISWSGDRDRGLRIDLDPNEVIPPTILHLSKNQIEELVRIQIKCAIFCTDEKSATRHLSQLIIHRQNSRYVDSQQIDLKPSIEYIRAFFAKNELFRTVHFDAFEIAERFFRQESQENIHITTRDISVSDAVATISFEEKHKPKNQLHQEILNILRDWTLSSGNTPYVDKHIDMYYQRASTVYLFEIKTHSEENFLSQMRLAIGQLIEYRYRLQKQIDKFDFKLVIVSTKPQNQRIFSFLLSFLESLSIDLILFDKSDRSITQILPR